MKFKKYNCALLCSIVCFTISSASFILIPISDFNGTKIERILAYMVGILFWLGFIIGLTMTFVLGRMRRKVGYKKDRITGLFCFFNNKIGKICDIAMLISLIVIIAAKILLKDYNLLWPVMLSIAMFLIFMHSIINGNNYSYAFQEDVKQ